MKNLKQILSQIFLTHIGRISLGICLSIIGLVLSCDGAIGELYRNPYYVTTDWWLVIGVIGTTLWVTNGLLFIVFGLIINPIKMLMKK